MTLLIMIKSCQHTTPLLLASIAYSVGGCFTPLYREIAPVVVKITAVPPTVKKSSRANSYQYPGRCVEYELSQ